MVERLSALLAEWPCADIRRFFKSCDIPPPSREPPGDGSRRWLVQQSLNSLDLTNTVDVLRLQMVCRVVGDATRAGLSNSAKPPNVVSKRKAKKLDDLEAVMRHTRTR